LRFRRIARKQCDQQECREKTALNDTRLFNTFPKQTRWQDPQARDPATDGMIDTLLACAE
jgi:hypothetical protein